MKITLIGTSHGVPEPHRKCSCSMIEVEGRYYFIDMGCMASEELIRRGIAHNDVKAVFITHCHGDHTNGLPSFVDLCNWYFKQADPLIVVPEESLMTNLDQWLAVNETQPMKTRYQVTRSGVVYDDGFVKVIAIPTQHIAISYAYLVEAEGKAVLFSGDLKHPTVDFPMVDRKLDLLVCETAHFPPTECKPFFDQLRVTRIIHNHVSRAHIIALEEMKRQEHPYLYQEGNDGLEVIL